MPATTGPAWRRMLLQRLALSTAALVLLATLSIHAPSAGPARASFYPAGEIQLLDIDLGSFRPGDVAQAWLEIFNVP